MGARALTWLQGMSFRGRLLSLLLVVAGLQVIASGMTFHELQAAPAQQRAERQLADAVDSTMVGSLDTSVQRSQELLQLLAADPALQSAIVQGDRAAIAGVLEAVGSAGRDVRVTGPDGKPLTADRSDDPTIDGASLPLRRNGKLAGTLHADVVLDGDFLRDAARLTPTLPFVVEGATLRTQRGTDKIDRDDAKDGIRELKVDGKRQLAYFAPVPDVDDAWIGAAIPVSRIQEEQAAGRSSLWLFLVVLVVLMALVSFLVTHAISLAVGAFGRSASRLAQGFLDERVPVTGDDEMARVSHAFNDMADQLQLRIATLEDTEGRLRRQLQLFGDVLGQSGELADVLGTVCRAALDTTSANRARFWVRDTEDRWRLAACIGLRADDASPAQLELECTIRGHSITVGEAPQWLAVPSTSAGTALGILTLVRDDAPLAAEEVRLVEHLARQAAAAIDTARLQELQREQARRDGLTGLANHRHMQDVLLAHVEQHRRHGGPLGVVLLDVDNFKSINDTWGHEVGDRALKAIAGVLDQPLCDGSLSARYGGEEFVVVLPGLDPARAQAVAQHVCDEIRALVIETREGALRLTSSFGVSHSELFDPAGLAPATLLTSADDALYVAKRSGKDRVVMAERSDGSPALRLAA